MARHALIIQATGLVENVIELVPGADWPIPTGRILVESLVAGPGDHWNGTDFIPSIPPPDPIIAQRAAWLAATAAQKLSIIGRRFGLE